MSVDSIEMWHKRARPNPTDADFNVQLGCHFEEIAEMLETMVFHTPGFPSTPGEVSRAHEYVSLLAERLKACEVSVTVIDRNGFLDSLADQIVTAVGVGHCAGMNTSDACVAVNSSNWSKFSENGYPLFDENGKIKKGPNYRKPDLEGMY
jgi:predicted HAD superfamily Cof-like phosphohydrolase